MDRLRLWGIGLAILTLTWSAPARAAKIACVGDSITYGYGLANPGQQSYPAVLQTLLGSKHTVKNFGTSGCTLLKKGDKPYWNDANFGASDAFKPDVVVVMLGTNDAKPQNWSRKADFAGDYRSLIEHYRGPGALVYVAPPPPVVPPGAFDIPADVVSGEVVPLVRQVATDAGAPLIDIFAALGGKSGNFPDKIHPDAAGAQLIAETVAAALEGGGFGGAGGTSTGGVSGSGGTTWATGGATGSGGGSGSGGRTGAAGNAGSGGISSSGGAPGGTGGSSTSDGAVSSGGIPGSGGALASTGGTATSTGGAAGSAGASSNAGGAGSGGNVGSGGRSEPGGRPGSGGASAGGGSAASGAGGDQPGSSTITPSTDGGASGCGCGVLRAPRAGVGFALLFALLALRNWRVRARPRG